MVVKTDTLKDIEQEVDVRESTITSDNREVFIALASLIRAGRHEMALTVLDNELGGGC